MIDPKKFNELADWQIEALGNVINAYPKNFAMCAPGKVTTKTKAGYRKVAFLSGHEFVITDCHRGKQWLVFTGKCVKSGNIVEFTVKDAINFLSGFKEALIAWLEDIKEETPSSHEEKQAKKEGRSIKQPEITKHPSWGMW